jgi:hypothetical protein
VNYLAPLLALPALLFQCGTSTVTSGPATTVYAPVPPRSGPAKHVVLQRGETRTFAPGALRPGDVVSCKLGGKPLTIRVPNRPVGSGWAIGTDAATQNGSSGEMQLQSNTDGSIKASCGR